MQLSPTQLQQALGRAKSAKWGRLYRDYQVWRQLNCELVPDGPSGELAYVLKEGVPTQPTPWLPAKEADVELTPEEFVAAIQAAQVRVWGDWQAAYRLANPPGPALASRAGGVPVTFETVRSWALRQAEQVAARRQPAFRFALDEHNRRVFELLCYYHAGDTQFEVLGEAWGFGPLSLQKGNALFGGVGRGKTILQEVFRHSPTRPYGVVSARKVSDVFAEDLTASEGKRPVVSPAQRLYRGVGDTRALCFDDLAREESRYQHMGNWVYPMQRVILDRYEAVQRGRLPLWATHLTSNNPLEPDDATPGMKSLTELYGEPAIDRLYELCNIIPLAGPSRRG